MRRTAQPSVAQHAQDSPACTAHRAPRGHHWSGPPHARAHAHNVHHAHELQGPRAHDRPLNGCGCHGRAWQGPHVHGLALSGRVQHRCGQHGHALSGRVQHRRVQHHRGQRVSALWRPAVKHAP